MAKARGAEIVTVAAPMDGNWTNAVLASLDERTAVAALPHCHWTDGSRLDLVKIGERCRALGAALVVDGIQSVGALPFDIGQVQPDFLVAASHKWLLGAYSCGFCYVAPKWQVAVPLEENWLNRAGSEDFSRLVDYRDDYQPGARRFDMGAASNFILNPVAAAGMEQILAWGVGNVAATLDAKISEIAAGASDLGFTVPTADQRAPHMIGITKSGGLNSALANRLAQEKVFVSVRGDAIRIAPHLYNSEEDLERLLTVLADA